MHAKHILLQMVLLSFVLVAHGFAVPVEQNMQNEEPVLIEEDTEEMQAMSEVGDTKETEDTGNTEDTGVIEPLEAAENMDTNVDAPAEQVAEDAVEAAQRSVAVDEALGTGVPAEVLLEASGPEERRGQENWSCQRKCISWSTCKALNLSQRPCNPPTGCKC